MRTNRHYDYLPLSKDSARLFLLADHPWNALPHAVNGPWGKTAPKKWRFTTAKYQGIWQAKDGGWVTGTWTDPEELEVSFTEAFHVYGLGKDYYFVTESGKVYVSPPLKGGETVRKVAPLWNDPQQPITHLLTDVDGPTPQLTYAFGSSSRADASKKQERFYIKLQGQEATPTYFRAGQLQPAPDLDEPLKTLLEYSRLIRFGPGTETPADPDVTVRQTPLSNRSWYIIGACLALVLVAAVYYYRRSRISQG